MKHKKQDKPVTLRLDQLSSDRKFQTRVAEDEKCITEYADPMRDGQEFPPIIVYRPKPDSEPYLILDGFQRVEATRRAKRPSLRAIVFQGTEQEAWKQAFLANAKHGLQRKSRDKRKAVAVALRQFPGVTDRSVAEMCGVSADLVGTVRNQLSNSDNSTYRRGKDGKLYPARKSRNASQPSPPVKDTPSGETEVPVEEPREIIRRALNNAMDLLHRAPAPWNETWDQLHRQCLVASVQIQKLRKQLESSIKEGETNEIPSQIPTQS